MLITLARKPLNGSVVQNCLQHGCGALNVDASRIGSGGEVLTGGGGKLWSHYRDETEERAVPRTNLGGRWPANVLLTESGAIQMDTQSGDISSQTKRTQPSGKRSWFETGVGGGNMINYADKGGASRFFKQIKDTP